MVGANSASTHEAVRSFKSKIELEISTNETNLSFFTKIPPPSPESASFFPKMV